MQLALIDYTSPEWESLPNTHRLEVNGWMAALSEQPAKGITRWLREVGEKMGLEQLQEFTATVRDRIKARLK